MGKFDTLHYMYILELKGMHKTAFCSAQACCQSCSLVTDWFIACKSCNRTSALWQGFAIVSKTASSAYSTVVSSLVSSCMS